MAKSGSGEVVKSRLLGKLGRFLRFVLSLCPWRLGEVLLPLPARKVTIGLILPMVAPPESGRFRVSPPSHPVSSVWTVGWSLEKLWNRVPVLGLGVWQVLFVACGGQQVPEKLEGFRRYAMISQCCGLFLD
ncbi:hypothetical protein YC2023_030601 [Brassica napus]